MHTPARPSSTRRDGRFVLAVAIALLVGLWRYGWTWPSQSTAIALAALLGHAGGQHAARRRLVVYRCQPPPGAAQRRPASTVRIVGAPAWAIELPADGTGVDGAVTRAIARGILTDLAADDTPARAITRQADAAPGPRRSPRRPALRWPADEDRDRRGDAGT